MNWFYEQGSLSDWLTAVGTFGAVLLTLSALLFKRFERWKNKAKFSISKSDLVSGCYMQEYNSFDDDHVVVGLVIEQIKGTEATDVECIIEKVWRYDISSPDVAEAWTRMPITNLHWGVGDNKKLTERFVRGVKRYCSLLTYIEDNPSSDSFPSICVSTAEKIGDPNKDAYSAVLPLYNISKWKFDLLLIGNNVKQKRFSVEVSVDEGKKLNNEGEVIVEKIIDTLSVKIVKYKK